MPDDDDGPTWFYVVPGDPPTVEATTADVVEVRLVLEDPTYLAGPAVVILVVFSVLVLSAMLLGQRLPGEPTEF